MRAFVTNADTVPTLTFWRVCFFIEKCYRCISTEMRPVLVLDWNCRVPAGCKWVGVHACVWELAREQRRVKMVRCSSQRSRISDMNQYMWIHAIVYGYTLPSRNLLRTVPPGVGEAGNCRKKTGVPTRPSSDWGDRNFSSCKRTSNGEPVRKMPAVFAYRPIKCKFQRTFPDLDTHVL